MRKSQLKPKSLLVVVVTLICLIVSLAQRISAAGAAVTSLGDASTESRFGLTVYSLTPAILSKLGLPADTTGVIVTNVERGSVAEEAGLRVTDIIQEVNQTRVTDLSQFRKAMQDVDTMVMFLVNRSGEDTFVALEAPSGKAR